MRELVRKLASGIITEENRHQPHQGLWETTWKIQGEIEKFCSLAAGLKGIVVLLQRPAQKHEYHLDFQSLVSQASTRRGLDELIRFVTEGPRGIRSVSVPT